MSQRNSVSVTVKTSGPATVKVTVTQSGDRLVFGKGNAKLKDVTTFSLPAGWACPSARECLAKADKDTGKVTDGQHTRFRCFSASQEAIYPSVRKARWANLEALRGKGVREMADLIQSQLPKNAHTVRVHVSGDFFSQDYFDAWLEVARRRPDVLFYWYTKSVRLWLARFGDVGDGHTPGGVPNFVPTASRGGKDDELIDWYGLRSAAVVYSRDEAARLELEIDDDDSHAMSHGPDFALLIHGTQPPGSDASKALSALRAQGEFGYGEKAAGRRKSLAVVNN
jgi:hypothetical protein